MPIPFIDLRSQFEALEGEIRARMDRVLEHGQYIMGPEVSELEERLAGYTESKILHHGCLRDRGALD